MKKDALPPGMRQPESLKTTDYLPWSRGRGVDVWAMLVAAMNGDFQTIRSLEAQDPGLLRCELDYLTPLHFAIRENQFAVVKYLLETGVRPVFSFEGPMAEAARVRGYEELAVFLEGWLLEHFQICPEGMRLPPQ